MRKRESKMIDPPRFPKIINPIENKAKKEFSKALDDMIKELTINMVKESK